MTEITKIAIFKGKKVRRIIYQNAWYFSVVDIIEVLTDSDKPRDYWYRMKKREKESSGVELSTLCRQLKLTSLDGKKYLTEVVDTENAFRIVQSIPSPKAEPFKRWLARVGYERVKEIEDPELATKRTRLLYKAKGYPESWIEKRMRGIVIREELTDEWQKRGARLQKDYEILTAEISKATFGVVPNQYKRLKGLKKENLRDHMGDFELIFTMLGERATTDLLMEIERKFFVTTLPNLANRKKVSCERYYLYIGKGIEVRIQKEVDKYTFERKVATSRLGRDTQKFAITKEEFEAGSRFSFVGFNPQ